METNVAVIKKHWVIIAAALTITFAILWNVSTPSSTPVQPVAASPTASSAEAARQFDDTMHLAEQAGLVSSYKFSDTERVIYVTDLWYSMTVSFKKDFLAKVAMLQEAISGYHYFEVRNDHSNEKVGEVTAFGGSLEVYK